MNTNFRLLLRFKGNKNVLAPSLRFSTSLFHRNDHSETGQLKPYQSVADYYAGKSVFLTGATGFIGTLMIERLLYTCKDIENIYILIRPKRNASIEQRLEELLNNPVYAKLKATRPQELRKIVPIVGDITSAQLGIKREDEQTLIEKVSVVFHAAANVKFRAPLSELLRDNYEGTKKVMDIGKKMTHLDVFVYISTAFNNSLYPIVDEVAYPPPYDIEEVYQVLARHKIDNNSNNITKLLGHNGNTYAFTKKMAEGYVAQNVDDIHKIIIRPAMVTSVYKEPLPGYTDSWVAGTSVLCDIASGLTRVVPGDKECNIEIIPADYVCNTIIIAAAKRNRADKLNVYNISTGGVNPINWERISNMFIKEGKKNDYMILPFPMAYFTNVTWVVSTLNLLSQFPTLLMEMWLRLRGKKSRYMKLQRQAISRSLLVTPVSQRSWRIKTTKAQQLISSLDNKDKNTFPCDPATVYWDEYIPIYCEGVKQYMIEKKNDRIDNNNIVTDTN